MARQTKPLASGVLTHDLVFTNSILVGGSVVQTCDYNMTPSSGRVFTVDRGLLVATHSIMWTNQILQAMMSL